MDSSLTVISFTFTKLDKYISTNMLEFENKPERLLLVEYNGTIWSTLLVINLSRLCYLSKMFKVLPL